MKLTTNSIFIIFILIESICKINGQKNLFCAFNPCKNNGTCIEINAGYFCFCTNEYFGIHCKTKINKYPSRNNSNFYSILARKFPVSPCKNDGKFVSSDKNSLICLCKNGTTGKFCEILIDSCASNPCQGSGMCRSFKYLYACLCFAGYTGKNCEIKLNDCLSDPCKNNGTCINYSFGYACECQVGFTGTLCQSQLNDCCSSPCKNATCVPLKPSGYKCEVRQNYCSSNPCVHGTCINTISRYKCICSSEYTGKRCERKYYKFFISLKKKISDWKSLFSLKNFDIV